MTPSSCAPASQIDIPVLDNDIAPAGGEPTLNPASIVSSSPAALAFAGGDVLRYLAPTEPGEYRIDYSVYTTGAPALADPATVRIQVLPDDANRAPMPETLEGRVLSGQSTLVEFDGFGMDPGRGCREPRPHREPARQRIGDDRRRRRVDPVHERARVPRAGVVPLSRRGRVRRDGRGHRAPRSPGRPVQSRARSPSPITCRCRRERRARSG